MQPPPESGHLRGSSGASAAPRRSVGCMSGLLRLLSPYHRSHHRKRLTAKNATVSPPPQPPIPKKKPPVPPSPSPPPPTEVRRRRSCEAPRSPTISPEHRRASCDSPRPPPPAIVARLMGLEESAPPSPAATQRPTPPPPRPETAAEKRRKLLGALEKCDEDLKTLRRIIAAVRAAELRAAAAAASDGTDARAGKTKWMDGADEPSPPQHKALEEQYPSPDSVLDAISSPRFPCRKRSSPCTNLDADVKGTYGNGTVLPTVGSKIVKPSCTAVFLGEYCKKPREVSPTEAHAVAIPMHHPVAVETIPTRLPKWSPRRWERQGRSQAMVESVGEVWGHGVGEERWEAGRVGVVLERAILQDLVGDVVSELLVHCGRAAFGACRKRLSF